MLLERARGFKVQVSTSFQVLVGASITYPCSPREALGYCSHTSSSSLFPSLFSPMPCLCLWGAALSLAPDATRLRRQRALCWAGQHILFYQSALQTEAEQQRALGLSKGDFRLRRKEVCLLQPLYLMPSRQ